jgi:thioredoxin reductase
LAARENNLRFIVLEQDTVEFSIRNHPRRKIAGQVVLDLPLAGRIVLNNTPVKQLIDLWNGIIIKYRLPLQENCRVKSVIRLNGYYNLITAEQQNFTSSYVLLAIGRRGSPEKLNIPGENLNKVRYRIDHPGSITGKNIVIAGNNNIAVEAALSLSEKNNISLVCFGESFAEVDPLIRKSVEKVIRSGKITIFYKTSLISIDEKYVYLSGEEGFNKLCNDLVFIINEGEHTSEFLEKAGIGTSGVTAESYLHYH